MEEAAVGSLVVKRGYNESDFRCAGGWQRGPIKRNILRNAWGGTSKFQLPREKSLVIRFERRVDRDVPLSC
jgi:hypothetical protein